MNYSRRLILFLLLNLVSFAAFAQGNLADSTLRLIMISVNYSPNLPSGDLSNRFGLTHLIGASVGYKMKNNFYFTAGYNYLFGDKVKEAVATNILSVSGNTKGGYIGAAIGTDGRVTTVRFFERGFTLPLMAGKIFPLIKSINPNSGFYVEAGGQFIQHKIFLEVVGSDLPTLSKINRRGYDRLSNGFGIVEGLGFRYHSNNRLLNLMAGFEFSQNFTRSRRDINWDTATKDTGTRFDFLWGFKVGWSFLIYRRSPEKEYFY